LGYGAGDEEGGIATIHRAHELGVTFIDTAELYGAGTGSNEKPDGDLARIHEILPDGAHGSRYPDAMMPQWSRNA
jgi:aryl-alcohol dehydrogenase-like predicted oxidoreductase